MAGELAAVHPVETWQVLVGSFAIITGLFGVLYGRLNKDIEGGDKRQDEYETIADNRINAISRDLEGVSTEVKTITKQISDIFKKLTTGADSFGLVREDIREIETRMEGLIREIEQRAGSQNDTIRESKEELNKLKTALDRVEKKCISQHPGRVTDINN